MAPQNTPRSINIPVFPVNFKVKGSIKLRPIMEESPGIAPTKIPTKLPTKTTNRLKGWNTSIITENNVDSIQIPPFYLNRRPMGSFRPKSITNTTWTKIRMPKVRAASLAGRFSPRSSITPGTKKIMDGKNPSSCSNTAKTRQIPAKT